MNKEKVQDITYYDVPEEQFKALLPILDWFEQRIEMCKEKIENAPEAFNTYRKENLRALQNVYGMFWGI